MKLVTVQAAAIKSTFEVLKDILNDVNIYFKPDGVYIVTLDTARTSLIDMYLPAGNFEEYICEHDVDCGVNMTNMYKLLKTITVNDVLVISINSKEFMNIEIHSEQKKTSTISRSERLSTFLHGTPEQRIDADLRPQTIFIQQMQMSGIRDHTPSLAQQD